MCLESSLEGRPHGCLPAGPPFSKHLRFCLELFLYGVDLCEVAMVTPLLLHFAHTQLLPALLTIGTYPPYKYSPLTS